MSPVASRLGIRQGSCILNSNERGACMQWHFGYRSCGTDRDGCNRAMNIRGTIGVSVGGKTTVISYDPSNLRKKKKKMYEYWEEGDSYTLITTKN